MITDFSDYEYEDLKLAEGYILSLELLGFDIVSDDIKMTISEALSEKEQIINTEEYENEL